jgi:hypothetical protein
MTDKNPRPLTQPEPGDPNYQKSSYQPGSLHTTDLPMQPTLAEQLGLRNCLETPDSSLGARFPQLPAGATMHDRLRRDEEILKYINGSES